MISRHPKFKTFPTLSLPQLIAKGKNKMPGYEKSLKDADIKELVTYVRQLAKGK